jgi:hypothetical protein
MRCHEKEALRRKVLMLLFAAVHEFYHFPLRQFAAMQRDGRYWIRSGHWAALALNGSVTI